MSTADRNKPPLSLEKLIALVVSLVEKSRNISGQLELSDNDLYVLQGMKVTFSIQLFMNLGPPNVMTKILVITTFGRTFIILTTN